MTERKLYIEPFYIEEIEKKSIKYENLNYVYDVDHNIGICVKKLDKELNVGVVYDFTYEDYDDEDTYSYLVLKKDNDIYYLVEYYYGKFIQTKEGYLASCCNKYTSEEIKSKFGIDMDEWLNKEINTDSFKIVEDNTWEDWNGNITEALSLDKNEPYRISEFIKLLEEAQEKWGDKKILFHDMNENTLSGFSTVYLKKGAGYIESIKYMDEDEICIYG